MESIKWVRPDLMHLTLAFLGNTPSGMIPEIVENMNRTARSYAAFSLKVNGVGVFPGLHKPRVLWMGIEDRLESLKNIQEQLRQQLIELGFELEERTLSPHLTLGRIKFLKNPELLLDIMKEYEKVNFHEEQISELILYESITRPEGPEYLPLARCALSR